MPAPIRLPACCSGDSMGCTEPARSARADSGAAGSFASPSASHASSDALELALLVRQVNAGLPDQEPPAAPQHPGAASGSGSSGSTEPAHPPVAHRQQSSKRIREEVDSPRDAATPAAAAAVGEAGRGAPARQRAKHAPEAAQEAAPEAAPAPPPAPAVQPGTGRVRKAITLDNLKREGCFDMTQQDAAEHMGGFLRD